MKECPDCGREYFEGENFCEYCGVKLEKLSLDKLSKRDIKNLVNDGALSPEKVLKEEKKLIQWLKEKIKEKEG